MINTVKSITHHEIVHVVAKKETGISLQVLFQKLGFKSTIVTTIYEALQTINQEMPHLILCEAQLSDGNAAVLFDRVQQNAFLKKTPFILHILKKSDMQSMPPKKFSAVFIGDINPKLLIGKINEVFNAFSNLSPHYISVESLKIPKNLILSVDGMVMGKTFQHLIARSNVELDSMATLHCNPLDDRRFPGLELSYATNLRQKENVFNLFPLNRISGRGRLWVEKLPALKVPGKKIENSSKLLTRGLGKNTPKKVLFFDPNESRLHQYTKILSSFDIELLPAPTMAIAAALLKQKKSEIDCIFLHELDKSEGSLEWRKIYDQLPANGKVPVLLASASIPAFSTGGIRYLKRPIGISALVDFLYAYSEKPDLLALKIDESGFNGIPVKFQVQSILLGLDETGGILQIGSPISRNCKVTIAHEFLTQELGLRQINITAISELKGRADRWMARFEAITVGTSKLKYWEKVSKSLDVMKNDHGQGT